MNAPDPIIPTPADAAKAYVRAGLTLVAFDTGSKGPNYQDWNLPGHFITTDAQASNLYGSMGLAHVPSRTCCLDIDNMPKAVAWCRRHGIDLKALCRDPRAVLMTSGRRYRLKVFFQLPLGVEPLQSYFKGDGIELRCGTAEQKTVHDVLPPSVHPLTGKRYRWLRREDCWRHMPELPPHVLTVWKSLNESKSNTGKVAPVGASREAIAALLACYKPDPGDDYYTWLNIGFALHHETCGSNVGLELWDGWSKQGSRYKGRE